MPRAAGILAQAVRTAREEGEQQVIASCRVGDVCTLVVDCPHSTPQWTSDGVLVFRTGNIRDGQLDLRQPSFTTEADYRERVLRAIPSPGDIIVTREAPVGEVAIIPQGVRGCLGQRMVLLRPDAEKVHAPYMAYALTSSAVQREMKIRSGTGSTVANLRIPSLKSLPFPCPPLPEQKAIAAALGDMDVLLGALDRRREKTRLLKQGMMQELLTGRTRLV